MPLFSVVAYHAWLALHPQPACESAEWTLAHAQYLAQFSDGGEASSLHALVRHMLDLAYAYIRQSPPPPMKSACMPSELAADAPFLAWLSHAPRAHRHGAEITPALGVALAQRADRNWPPEAIMHLEAYVRAGKEHAKRCQEQIDVLERERRGWLALHRDGIERLDRAHTVARDAGDTTTHVYVDMMVSTCACA